MLKQCGIDIVHEKFEEIDEQQRSEENSEESDVRKMFDHLRHKFLGNDIQTKGKGHEIENQGEGKNAFFQDFAFAQQQRVMTLRK